MSNFAATMRMSVTTLGLAALLCACRMNDSTDSDTYSGGAAGLDSGGVAGIDSTGAAGTDTAGAAGVDSGGAAGLDSGGVAGIDSTGAAGTDTAGGAGIASAGAAGELNLAPADALEQLGVNMDVGPRQDPDGMDLDPNFHPLGRPRSVLAPLAELYLAGLSYGGVREDDKNGGGELYRDDDLDYVDSLPLTRNGDVDGDGRDEIVIVYWDYPNAELWLKVIDRVDGAYVVTKTRVASNVTWEFPEVISPAVLMSMAIGDLDDDGRDEVAFSFFNTVRVFDDAEAGHTLLASRYMQMENPGTPLTWLRLGIGNFFGDDKERLLVTVTPMDAQAGACDGAQYHIFKDALLEDQVFTWLRRTDGEILQCVTEMGVGDVDGDNLDEVVLNAEDALWVMDDQHAGGNMLTSTPTDEPAAIVLDVDGDGMKEVVDRSRLYDFENGVLRLVDSNIRDGDPSNQVPYTYGASVGDIDGDLCEEWIVGGSEVRIFGNDGAGQMRWRKALPFDASVVGAANLDDDSLTLEYTGKSELRFTSPRIMAVLAAPPGYLDIGQQGGSTTFGKTNEEQTDASASLGVSLGFSVGAKAGADLLGIGAEASVKTTFKASMTFSAGVSTLLRTTYSYTSGAEEDKVIFAVVPVDIYYYDVLAAADPAAVGTIVGVNLPRKPQILSVSRSYYNANNGAEQDVGPEVLEHTIGEPFSYPTAAEREEHLAAGLQLIDEEGRNPLKQELGGWINEQMVTVGEGSGLQTLTIESSKSTSYGVSLDLSAEIEAEVSAGVVVGGSAGLSAGLSTGVEFNVTATEGFFVEGAIGDIPAEHFTSDKLYRAGLYAYPQQVEDQQFLVVNYWVSK
jgi:hypothetical protein